MTMRFRSGEGFAQLDRGGKRSGGAIRPRARARRKPRSGFPIDGARAFGPDQQLVVADEPIAVHGRAAPFDRVDEIEADGAAQEIGPPHAIGRVGELSASKVAHVC